MREASKGWKREHWGVVERTLPEGWREKAKELGALKRRREFVDPSVLMRVMFMHVAEDCSFRETSVRAEQSGLAAVSSVALWKRLRQCGPWFCWIAEQLMRRDGAASAEVLSCGYRVRTVDGSTVSEPAATGSTWRLHYSLQLPSMSCDEVHVTEASVGETLCHFKVLPRDLLVADRGYAHHNGVRHVDRYGGVVIVRLNLRNFPLVDAKGVPIELLSYFKGLRVGEVGEWPVWIAAEKGQKSIAGRVCAIRKSETAARREREKVIREAKKKGNRVQRETLAACSFTFVFTTLPKRIAAAVVMKLYRCRWQVELAFKRLKSILGLDMLNKTEPAGARAWLQGKLLIAILLEVLIGNADNFSPWGYCIDQTLEP